MISYSIRTASGGRHLSERRRKMCLSKTWCHSHIKSRVLPIMLNYVDIHGRLKASLYLSRFISNVLKHYWLPSTSGKAWETLHQCQSVESRSMSIARCWPEIVDTSGISEKDFPPRMGFPWWFEEKKRHFPPKQSDEIPLLLLHSLCLDVLANDDDLGSRRDRTCETSTRSIDGSPDELLRNLTIDSNAAVVGARTSEW